MTEFNVLPVNDLLDHEDGAECPCQPDVQPEQREDGSMAWLIVHNAWDGRE